jgi:hypothetical protein
MARNKNTECSTQTVTFGIPAGSDLLSRLEKISEQTGLDIPNLLLKWVLQEESLLGVMQYGKSRMQKRPQIRSLPDASSSDPAFAQAQARGNSGEQEQEEAAEANPDNLSYRKMLIKRTKKLKREGLTLVKIAEMYNEEKLPTVSGRGKWYSSSITWLLNL